MAGDTAAGTRGMGASPGQVAYGAGCENSRAKAQGCTSASCWASMSTDHAQTISSVSGYSDSTRSSWKMSKEPGADVFPATFCLHNEGNRHKS